MLFVLTGTTPQQNASNGRAEGVRGGYQRDDAPAPTREGASIRDTPMNLGVVLQWTLGKYRRGCAGLVIVKRFDATAAIGKNLVVYDRHRFERDMALGAWKRYWAVPGRWFVGIFVYSDFAIMPVVRSI